MKTPHQTHTLSSSGKITNHTKFQGIVIHPKGKYVKLKDLGSTSFSYKDQETYVRMNFVPAISLAITKRSGENLLEIVV